MESVLHIEPMVRHGDTPRIIGRHTTVTCGYTEGDEHDPLGDHVGPIRLGCPTAVNENNAPKPILAKSFEVMQDHGDSGRNVYLENIHLIHDHYFIPVKTKIHSGINQGRRLTHVPSISYARAVVGDDKKLYDFRGEAVNVMCNYDHTFLKNSNTPVLEWMQNDLVPALDDQVVSEFSFSTKEISKQIDGYRNRCSAMNWWTNDDSIAIRRQLAQGIGVATEGLPMDLHDSRIVGRSLYDVRARSIYCGQNLKLPTALNLSELPNILHNSSHFLELAELLDRVMLTDFNLDIIVGVDCAIMYRQYHVATNCFNVFEDNDVRAYDPDSILEYILLPKTLKRILSLFLQYHPGTAGYTSEIIHHQPIKMKLVKTSGEEAAVLLFPASSGPNDLPLCGVYFDLAWLSFAPMSLIEV